MSTSSIQQMSRLVLIFATCLILAACGGGGGGSDNASRDSGGSGGGNDTVVRSSVTLSWQAPTQNTDGSPLVDLSGYKIYYGTELDNYDNVITIDNPGITTYLVDDLPVDNTYYFAITAVDTDLVESDYSNIGNVTLL